MQREFIKYFLLFSLLPLTLSLSIDNGIVGDAEIECGSTAVNLRVKTRNEFGGNVFVKPIFVTKTDRAYRVHCYYMEMETTVKQRIDVGEMSTVLVEHTVEMPKCGYEILSGGPDGTPVSYAEIGQMVYHLWKCESGVNAYCMVVHSCFVDDGRGQRTNILDEQGCTLDSYVLPDLEYTQDLRAGQISHVYKYADRSQLFYQCQISVNVKDPFLHCPRPQCQNKEEMVANEEIGEKKRENGNFPVPESFTEGNDLWEREDGIESSTAENVAQSTMTPFPTTSPLSLPPPTLSTISPSNHLSLSPLPPVNIDWQSTPEPLRDPVPSDQFSFHRDEAVKGFQIEVSSSDVPPFEVSDVFEGNNIWAANTRRLIRSVDERKIDKNRSIRSIKDVKRLGETMDVRRVLTTVDNMDTDSPSTLLVPASSICFAQHTVTGLLLSISLISLFLLIILFLSCVRHHRVGRQRVTRNNYNNTSR